MQLLTRIKQAIRRPKEQDPAKAYDIWAPAYDQQPGNLMLDLDEQVFGSLLRRISVENMPVIDVGCGTGRHWPKLLSRNPGSLTGYDVSEGMLAQLKAKFPAATVRLLNGNQLEGIADRSVSLLISTLTLAHIADPKNAFMEWDRVLCAGANIIITDYHPVALKKGGQRTFNHEGRTIAVRNHIHNIDFLRTQFERYNWDELQLEERIIDDTMKSYYENKGASALFDEYKGTPIIYGILLKKRIASS
jgi:ubiquinone/menaquinone biosynthesis C-methylase UbiE